MHRMIQYKIEKLDQWHTLWYLTLVYDFNYNIKLMMDLLGGMSYELLTSIPETMQNPLK